MRILVFVLSILSWNIAQIAGSLNEILDVCCSAGSDWALTEYGRCDNYPSLVDGVARKDQPSCRGIVEVCCMKQRHISMCEKGKAAAQENMFCVVADTEFGSEQFKECCLCCQLGLVAQSIGLPCNLLNFGGPCDRIFSQCCIGKTELHSNNYTTTLNINDFTTSTLTFTAFASEITTNTPETVTHNSVTVTESTSTEPSTEPIVENQTPETPNTREENPETDNPDKNKPEDIDPNAEDTGEDDANNQNECELFTGELCDHICIDTPGSYYCECSEGYILMDDEKSCKKIQDGDCLVGEFLCDDGTCISGEYRCDGYVADCPDNSDEQNCVGGNFPETDGEDPDLGIPNLCKFGNPCEQLCIGTELSVVCDCEKGYQLNIDGVSCTDIDECILERYDCPDDKMCINTRGSYMCCPIGSSYNPDKKTCSFVQDEATETPEKAPQCMLGYVHSAATQRCEDIDECTLGVAECAQGLSCQNTPGAYQCNEPVPSCIEGTKYNKETGRCEQTVAYTCDQGYIFNEKTRECDDLDECVMGIVQCPTGQNCVNTIGGYSCERMKPACPSGTVYNFAKERCEETVRQCSLGYTYDQVTRVCKDLNECALKTDDCSESFRCENTVGSYFCRRILDCGTGYTTDRDSQRCVDIDECEIGSHNCHGHYECKNTIGSFRCRPKSCEPGFRFNRVSGNCEKVNCPKGLKIYKNSGRCLDINECAELKNICKKYEECENNYGSYRCTNPCGSGYRRSKDGKRCEDVDECKEGKHDCKGDQVCINQRGRYVCRCPEGYELRREGRCVDIDECARYGRICQSSSKCVNTQGSFKCECQIGYRQDGPRCRDIDECFESRPCQHNCRNNHGSFSCSCHIGYTLAEDRRSCTDIDECKRPLYYSRGTLCGGVCRNTPGSYECQCPSGWKLLGDGRSCQDVDECADGDGHCPNSKAMCYNIRGGYKCPEIDCPTGFIPLFTRANKNRVRCKRITFACPPEDASCQSVPLSQSYNFLSFPENVNVPADLFSMSGPRNSHKYFTWDLKLLNVTIPGRPSANLQRITRRHFRVSDYDGYRAVVSIIQPIHGAQDVVLELYMMISDRNSYIGFAKSVITLYITPKENDN